MDPFNYFAISREQVNDTQKDERCALILNWIIYKLASNIEQSILSGEFDNRHHIFVKYGIVQRRFSWLTEKNIRDVFQKLKKLGIIETKEVWSDFLDKSTTKKRIQAVTLTEHFYKKYLPFNDTASDEFVQSEDCVRQNSRSRATDSSHASYNKKVLIKKESISELGSSPQNDIVSYWNKKCEESGGRVSEIKKLTAKRKKGIAMLSRTTLNTPDDWVKYIDCIFSCGFLLGENNSENHVNWRVTIDWALNENNCVKVLEGNYENKNRKEMDALFKELFGDE